MGSILIAMPKTEDANRIAGILKRSGLALEIEICSNGADVLRVANDREFGVILCSKRMQDMAYSELAEYMPRMFSMILLTSDASVETYGDRCVKLMYPLKSTDLIATIEMLTAGFFRRRKKDKPPKKRNEVEKQIIDQAKALLMERNGMEEPEAFRYLQKVSMDMGRSMVESAQMILAMG